MLPYRAFRLNMFVISMKAIVYKEEIGTCSTHLLPGTARKFLEQRIGITEMQRFFNKWIIEL